MLILSQNDEDIKIRAYNLGLRHLSDEIRVEFTLRPNSEDNMGKNGIHCSSNLRA